MAKRTQQTDRTRVGIEVALIRLLASKAYEAISMSDIAGEADVSVRTVQRHFGSKDRILAAALRYPAEAFSSELASQPPGRSPREDIQNLVTALFATYGRHRREMWAAYTRSSEAPRLLSALQVAAQAWMSAVEGLMARWSDRWAIDPQLARRAVVALTSYPTWRGLTGAGGFDSPEAETFVTKLLCEFIMGPGQGASEPRK